MNQGRDRENLHFRKISLAALQKVDLGKKHERKKALAVEYKL